MPFRKEYLIYDPHAPQDEAEASKEDVSKTFKFILMNQLTEFQTLKDALDYSLEGAQAQELKDLYEQTVQSINALNEYTRKERLETEERKAVLGIIASLAMNAASCTEAAQNAGGTMADRVQEIRKTMVETLSKLEPRPETVFNRPMLHTTHSYQSLHDRVGSVTSAFRGSSPEFKALRDALEAVRTADTDLSITLEQKRVLYDKLANASDLYLQHRIPDGNTAGLSGFAASRVQFAKDVMEFAEAKLDALSREAALSAAAAPANTINVIGKGELLEYDSANNVYVRFPAPTKTDETGNIVADSREELLMRMCIRNGGAEPDEDMLQQAGLLTPAGVLDANRTSQQLAESTYEEKLIRNAPAPVVKAPEQKEPEAAEEAPQEPAFADIPAVEAAMAKQRKLALQIMVNPDSSAENLLQAAVALMVTREYGPDSEAAQLSRRLGGEEPKPEQKAKIERRDQVLSGLQSGEIKYEDLIEAAYQNLKPILPLKPQDSAKYLNNLRSMMQKSAAQAASGKTAAAENCLFNELDHAGELRNIPDVRENADYLLGCSIIEENRAKAYQALVKDPSPEAQENALLCITACHELSDFSTIKAKYGQVLASGSTEWYSIDTCRQIHEYIKAVTEIGRDKRKLLNRVEAVRKELTPYLASGNSLAKERMKNEIEACRHYASNNASGPELYKKEGLMVAKLKEMNEALIRKQNGRVRKAPSGPQRSNS